MTEELKPCPFCGAQAHLLNSDLASFLISKKDELYAFTLHRVSCNECTSMGRLWTDPNEAIKSWNTRV